MRRAEAVVLALLALAVPAALAFAVLYVAEPDTQLLGTAIGAALLSLGIAAAVAGKRLLDRGKSVAPYPRPDDLAAQAEVADEVRGGAEGISRRRLLGGAAGAAGLSLGAAAALPLASLGPSVGGNIAQTPWRAGVRLVDADGAPLRAEAVVEGAVSFAFPEGASRKRFGSPVVVVRVDPAGLELPFPREYVTPGGVMAFSKICPHAGCAVSVYRAPLHEPTAPEPALVCPCHYSTFVPRRGGDLVFGPAGRRLPLLPVRVDGDGALVATRDFLDPIGPSYVGSRDA